MINGSFVAIVTPFNEDGSINYPKFGELIDYHINNGTNGIVVLGTTGEASTINYEDQIELVKYTITKGKNKIHIMVGAGSNDTSMACKLAKTFSTLGADSLLVITPYYNKTNKSGLIKHFEAICNASSAPIVLYNVPSRTGMNISPDVVEILAKNDKIIGIKEASGNLSYAMEISKYLNDDFVMMAGCDDLIVPYMSVGAKGVISVLANICPKNVSDICNACLNNDFNKAHLIALKTLSLANSLFIETNPIPVKEAMNYLGFNVGGYHLPLDNMSLENKEILILKINEAKGEINL